jgi:hypothetical protein
MTFRCVRQVSGRSATTAGRLLDQVGDSSGMGDHRDVARGDLDGGRAHPRCELPLGVGRDRLVVLRDEVPGRQRLPRRLAHHVGECGGRKGLLHGVQDSRAFRVDVGGEVVDEVVLGEPAEAARVGEEMRERRRDRSLREKRPERLTLVEAERGDVDEADDVGASEPSAVMIWPP